jgi:hypothetical protein
MVTSFAYPHWVDDDDDELNKIIQGKLADEKIYVQMSLDRSQSTGTHEKQILASWANDAFGNSIAIGTSSVHNAISHLKIVIVDGVYTVKGSTNWSPVGRAAAGQRAHPEPQRGDRRRNPRHPRPESRLSCSSRWSAPSLT